MAIKPKIANRLWGRAGGRCSECRLELSPVGGVTSTGEIAHIVAGKPDGPRGNEDLPLERRDDYDNLILLCCNDHRIVDTDVDTWTVERLKSLKRTHEQWFSDLVENGRAQPYAIDNTKFVADRQGYWISKGTRTWLLAALTPLVHESEVIAPLSGRLSDSFNNIRMPRFLQELSSPTPNPYNTEPSQDGLVNESFPAGKNFGHRIEAFRSGHLEFVTIIDPIIDTPLEDTNRARRHMGVGQSRLKKQKKSTQYRWIADAVQSQVVGINTIWKKSEIEDSDMILSIALLNVDGLCLFGAGGHCNVPGRPLDGERLEYAFVVDSGMPVEEQVEILLRRLVNCMGLTLDSVHNEEGGFVEPRKL